MFFGLNVGRGEKKCVSLVKKSLKQLYQGSQLLGLNDMTQLDIDGILNFNEMSYLARLLKGLGGVM